jgi:acetyl-CoA synthetase
MSAYEAIHHSLRWQVPVHFNIAKVCCRRWAKRTPAAVAIIEAHEDGRVTPWTYLALQQEANRLSRVLKRLGVRRGDCVAIVLPQCAHTAVAHVAVHQLGAISVPLSRLFGPDALQFRLQDSGAKLVIADAAAAEAIRGIRASCPDITSMIVVGRDPVAPAVAGELGWAAALKEQSVEFEMRATSADEPAVLIYTSGTTGAPKGALIPHRALIGNLSGFVCSQNGLAPADAPLWDESPAPEPAEPLDDHDHARHVAADMVFWSPADWAWTGGLMDALLPTLYFGRTIVGSQGRFSAEKAFELMQRHRVTHAFIFPTALKAMMKAVPDPASKYQVHLRGLMSAGEAVGDAVFAYCRDALGVTVNEMFGQTEINYVVGNSQWAIDSAGRRFAAWPAKPGSMGRPYPGHRVAVIDDAGNECAPGTAGDVAVHRLDGHGDPDPVFFLGYWQNDAATAAKFTGDPASSWCRTGDVATMDDDGYLWYQGRSDDMFKAAGYRIGPSEVENCLVKHPAVANAAVVPKPDAERGAVVKAFIVVAAGHEAGDSLTEELQAHVRDRLAPYEYPKEIEYVDALPMTTTGKLQRRVLRLLEEERARGSG